MTDTGIARPLAAVGPDVLPVSDALRAVARDSGDTQALLDLTGTGSSVTYAELSLRVDALASSLRANGAHPDGLVAVAVTRSADAIVAMLAVLAAGAVYCPLDTASPASRTQAILHRLNARIAVADVAGASGLGGDITVINPGTAEAFIRADGATPDPDSLAYVLHTSGSTGVPKAVAMTYRGLARLIAWQVADGRPALRTLHFTALSFDVSFQEVLSTLVTGGGLVVVPDPVRRDPDALLDVIVENDVQRVFLPYVALQLLAVSAQRRDIVPDSLEHVVTAGERLIVTPAIRSLFAAVPHCRLDNHYGPTEVHLVTSLALSAGPVDWPELPPIGSTVTGVSCAVLDDRLHPVKAGEIGELYVGGSGLARGYLGDPSRTAERFVADPGTPGGRIYRTGDLARAGTSGYEFVGRADRQLKVRGFRVEPAEVEQALLTHPQVDAAVVGMRDVFDGVQTMVGYVQAAAPLSHRDLTEHLRDRLPTYLIPTRFVTMKHLPRTSSNKVDASALEQLALPGAEITGDSPAFAQTSLPKTIAAIWRRVLGHDEFDVDDDFFDVGGDSLLATWVVTEIARELGRPVGLSVFLDYSTIADLAVALRGDGAAAPSEPRSSQITTLRTGPSGRALFLVHPLGGELLGYRELARASQAPLRLLGIGWSGAPPAFGTALTDLAAIHVAELRSVQPVGPYLLAGWSFGGVLAYEIAQQLRTAGETVDLLGLIDANPIIDPITGLPMAETPFLRMIDDVIERLAGPEGGRTNLADLTSGPTWTQLMGAPLDGAASSSYLLAVLETARICMRAAMTYRPEPYGGPVTLFQACGAGEERQGHLAAALRTLCDGTLTLVPLAGDHRGVLQGDDATQAAAKLDAALESAGTERNAKNGS